MRQLLDAVERGRWRLAASILLAAGASGASVALMGLSAWLLSRAAEMPPVLYLQAAAVGVRFFGISRGVLRYIERLVGHDLALRMQAALRLRTYDSLSRTTLLGRRRGDLLTRVVADATAIQDLVVRVVVPFSAASLVIVGTTVMIGRFSPGSAAVLFGSALLAGVLLPWLTQRLSLQMDAAAVPTRGRLADEVHQTSRAAQDLVAFGADRAALTRLLTVDEELRRIEARSSWARGLATAGQIVAAGIAVVAALWIGGHAVAAGELKPRLLAVLVLTPLALHEVFSTFTQSAQTFTRAGSALTRLAAVLDAEPVGRGDVEQVPSDSPGLVLDEVTVGWPGEPEPVLRDFSLSVQPGQRVALVGPSGIGKTTIAATVMGMIPAWSGEVSSTGRIGYLAQDAHLFATTVAENVRVGRRDATDEQISDALGRAGLDFPLDRLVGERGSTVSGGEARRIALARVLVDERDLLILDEPTEHLDHETAHALMTDLWRAVEDRPVLVITHDADVMAQCTQVVRLG
ncbi:thiol reductant ABC exporter subunit CydC [Aestuariimicrobium ganziense]|uniref:thiol reductant ABC exporter subunit CydC n=1 Tax=Aestuariimicrobium ganziense TaxID=2773677 RepID=UPI0019444C84|nr:thiol reductant ABC exporter subunit CydC [Aestuariimicrobium ganziense]